VSFGYFRSQDPGAGALLAGLSQAGGITAPIRLQDSEGASHGLEVHLLAADDGRRVLIAFNHRQEDTAVVVELASDLDGRVKELIVPAEETTAVEVEGGHLRTQMSAESVWVVELGQ
jgi:hypothetical protein